MSCSLEDIRSYFTKGRNTDHTHMLVMRDNFNYDCYPVYTSHPHAELKRLSGVDMQVAMEVYDLRTGFDWQNEHAERPLGRVWNLPESDPPC